MSEKLHLHVITGFLGSGKTTLLRNLLSLPEFSDTAVIVNEFGEVGLDHEMIESVEESTVVLKGGCVCCAVREDLATSIRKLSELRKSGKIPPFRRLVVETSGLADPVPMIFTLCGDPRIVGEFQLHGIIAVVDAVNGMENLKRFEESRRQVFYANRAVVTKVDIVEPDACAALEKETRLINPAISVVRSDGDAVSLAALFAQTTDARDSGSAALDWTKWAGTNTEVHHHHNFASLAWEFDQQIDWTAFGIWLTMLLHAHGDRILRVKGLLSVAGAEGPIAIHGVQHMVYPPVHLGTKVGLVQPSRVVVITKDIDPEIVKRSFFAFVKGEFVARGHRQPTEVSMGGGRMVAGRPIRRAGAPAWIKG
ncbi:GTP-binding protein [Limibacillus sp. MBR-115]|uniref:CobW family GTP-binding protein n=1 Tax=Limibacillus sp. MBR-115 TaxID=3156465 RepID=UPI00339A5AF6